MDLADEAAAAKRMKREDKSIDLFTQAFKLEKQAAEALLDADDCEPSRSVLYNSAMWLAKEAGLVLDLCEMANTLLSFTMIDTYRKEALELLEGNKVVYEIPKK